jgi:signal transduction histidine kinase
MRVVASALRPDTLSSRISRLWRALVLRPHDGHSFHRGAGERALERVIRARLLIAPVLASVALLFAAFEPSSWRRIAVASTSAVLLTLSVTEWVRYRQKGLGAIVVPLNVMLMGMGQVTFALASGGLFSPLVPGLIVTTVLASLLVERKTLLLLVGGIQIPALWAMACAHAWSAPVPSLVPSIFGDPGTLEDGAAPWIAASVYTALALVASRMGHEARRIFEHLYEDAVNERDRSLALHAEQSRALTLLSGEIAHELKNPLTSIKGLGAILAKDVREEKPAERLAVLRREVDRMQGILEEFLNFSRPLVPLALSEIDLVPLASDVARLHEGSASERGVALRVESARPVWLRCDPRKVRQIVINLVQNALEVSARGDEVRVLVQASDEAGVLKVLDRGPGLDASVAERVFEAGVTTKPHGSGLGLAVARSLARQHGGELTLRDREDGGCEATLELPRRPPEPEQP